LPKTHIKYDTVGTGFGSTRTFTLPATNAPIILASLSIANDESLINGAWDKNSVISFKVGNSTAFLNSYSQRGVRFNGTNLSTFVVGDVSLATTNAAVNNTVDFNAIFIKTKGSNNATRYSMFLYGGYITTGAYIAMAEFNLENFDRIQVTREDGGSMSIWFSASCFVI
jgi:hypothetical protein